MRGAPRQYEHVVQALVNACRVADATARLQGVRRSRVSTPCIPGNLLRRQEALTASTPADAT